MYFNIYVPDGQVEKIRAIAAQLGIAPGKVIRLLADAALEAGLVLAPVKPMSLKHREALMRRSFDAAATSAAERAAFLRRELYRGREPDRAELAALTRATGQESRKPEESEETPLEEKP